MGKFKEQSIEEVLNFGWGDTRGLRDLILRVYKNINPSMPLETYGYPPYDGDPVLVEMIRNLTYELTGVKYKNICITAGCTHAVNASVSALMYPKSDYMVTRKLYYPRYPAMASLNSLIQVNHEDHWHMDGDIAVIDTPSNPLGLIDTPELRTEEIIWDGAYHSPVYGMPLGVNMLPGAKIFCGSLSKLTGINGIRLGWTATDDDYSHHRIQNYVRNSVCGISYPSQELAKEVLKKNDLLHTYFQLGNHMINNNREEVLRLRSLFGSDKVSKFGMFAFFQIDEKMQEIFKEAKVEFTPGSDCGADYLSVRINLANSNEQTKEMVNRILKVDGI